MESEINVMQISPYSGIANKLAFLAKLIMTDAQADSEQLHIECYDNNGIKTIRLSNNTGIWTEVFPYDKTNGKLLPKSVTVNLYDFYNVADNCLDEMISLWIDEETNELVFNSYYSEIKDLDEVEFRINIIDSYAGMRNYGKGGELRSKVTLDQMTINQILNNLNYDSLTDGVNIIASQGTLSFQSSYKGITTDLVVKMSKTIDSDDFTIFVPFTLFNLMASTGQITPLDFSIYSNNILELHANEYHFIMTIDKTVTPYIFNEDQYKDYFVIDAKLFEETLKLLNKMTQQSKSHLVTFEKVNDNHADITNVYDGRYTASIRTDLAILSDDVLAVDSMLLQQIIAKNQVDAIRVKYNEKDVFIKYENAMIIKKTVYST